LKHDLNLKVGIAVKNGPKLSPTVTRWMCSGLRREELVPAAYGECSNPAVLTESLDQLLGLSATWRNASGLRDFLRIDQPILHRLQFGDYC
jgi:hypothetical protein